LKNNVSRAQFMEENSLKKLKEIIVRENSIIKLKEIF
jgi:hypothetical protein